MIKRFILILTLAAAIATAPRQSSGQIPIIILTGTNFVDYRILNTNFALLADAITNIPGATDTWSVVSGQVTEAAMSWPAVSQAVTEASSSWPAVSGAVTAAAGSWPAVSAAVTEASASWPAVSAAVTEASSSWPAVSGAVTAAAESWPAVSGAVSAAAASWPAVSQAVTEAAGSWPAVSNDTLSSLNNIGNYVFAYNAKADIIYPQAYTKLEYPTVQNDPLNFWDNDTFAPTNPGLYLIQFSFCLQDYVGEKDYTFQIMLDSSIVLQDYNRTGSQTGGHPVYFYQTFIQFPATTNKLYAQLSLSGGWTNTTTSGSGKSRTFFKACYMGK